MGIPQNKKIEIQFTLSLGFLAYPETEHARVSNERLTLNLVCDRRDKGFWLTLNRNTQGFLTNLKRDTIGTTLLHGKSNFPNYRVKKTTHLSCWYEKIENASEKSLQFKVWK